MESKKLLNSVLDDLQLGINFKISIQEQNHANPTKKKIEALIGANNGFNINIINGRFDEASSSLPKGVSVLKPSKVNNKELKACLSKSKNSMISVNHDLAKNGFTLKCNRADKVQDVYVNYINTFEDSFFNQMRNNYIFGQDCRINISERFFSANGFYKPQVNNIVSEISLEKNAQVKILSTGKMCCHHESKNYLSSFISQKHGSSFCYFNIGLNVNWSKNYTNIVLCEEGAKCNLYSAECLNNSQFSENDIFINHSAPECASKQVYKGVFSDKSTSSFNSCVHVSRDAQKTLAVQQNNNMILSDYAMVKSNPQLEIFADDVECAHGSTFGQLDKDALFYLQARGLKKSLAQKMLVKAFIIDVFEKIEHKAFEKDLLHSLDQKIQSLSESKI